MARVERDGHAVRGARRKWFVGGGGGGGRGQG